VQCQNIAQRENYKLDIFGTSEVRWDSFGEVTTQTGFTFLYSGYHADEGPVRRDGVRLLLSKIAKTSLIEWYPISERILTAHFKGNIRNVRVIQCYAPTDGWNTSCQKKAFYSQLCRVVTDSNKRDIKTVTGDLNAEVGTENEGLEHVVGRHGTNGIN
jgi:hypothetical protein